VFFGNCLEDRAEYHIIDGFGLGGPHLIRVLGGETDGRVGSDGIGRKEIFLAEMKRGAKQAGVIGAVVNGIPRVGKPGRNAST